MKNFLKRMSVFLIACGIVIFSIPQIRASAKCNLDCSEISWAENMEYDEALFTNLDSTLLDYVKNNYDTEQLRICHIAYRYVKNGTTLTSSNQVMVYQSIAIPDYLDDVEIENYVWGICFDVPSSSSNPSYGGIFSTKPIYYTQVFYYGSHNADYIISKFENPSKKSSDFLKDTYLGNEIGYRQTGGWDYMYYLDILYCDFDVVELHYDTENSKVDRTNAFAYLFDDERSNVIRNGDGIEPDYVYDNSIGFSTGAFSARRYFDSHTWGCQNIKVDFAPTSESISRMDSSDKQWYLELNMTFNAQMSWKDKSLLSPAGHTINDDCTVVVRYPIESFRNNFVIVNVYDVLTNLGTYSSDYILVSSDIGRTTIFGKYLAGYREYYTNYQYGNTYIDILSGSRQIGNDAIDLVGAVTGNCVDVLRDILSNVNLATENLEYSFANFDVDITGRLTDGTTRSNVGCAFLNMISGNNSSYTADVDSSGNGITQDGYRSDKNEYIVDASTGDTYYYDYSNHVTENVTTPSLNFSDNIALTHTFANALALHLDNASELAPTNNIYVYGTGNDSSDPDVIIEDDDYTSETLVQHMKDGFEILDNTDTEEKGDGIMSAASSLIAGLSDDYMKLFGFGIASVVTINILRSLFRR